MHCTGSSRSSCPSSCVFQMAAGDEPGGEGWRAEGEARGPHRGCPPIHEGGACLQGSSPGHEASGNHGDSVID